MTDGRTADATISVERVIRYSGTDLDDLCEATESAITEGGGFGWLKPPPRQVLENYWKGVLLVPERRLVVGRLDGVIAGSALLSRAPRNNEAQAFAQSAGVTLHVENLYGENNHHIAESCFKGLARALRQAVEIDPRRAGAVPSTKGVLGGSLP